MKTTAVAYDPLQAVRLVAGDGSGSCAAIGGSGSGSLTRRDRANGERMISASNSAVIDGELRLGILAMAFDVEMVQARRMKGICGEMGDGGRLRMFDGREKTTGVLRSAGARF